MFSSDFDSSTNQQPQATVRSTLIHELQLGNSLNQCVKESRRADFALMLALLTDDIREHSQFMVPQTQETEKQVDSDTLRKNFELPASPSLALSSLDEIDHFNQAEFAANNQLATLRLSQALNPKPLAFRDDAKHVPTVVLANTNIHCQERATKVERPKGMSMNAKAWLNALAQSTAKEAVSQTAMQRA